MTVGNKHARGAGDGVESPLSKKLKTENASAPADDSKSAQDAEKRIGHEKREPRAKEKEDKRMRREKRQKDNLECGDVREEEEEKKKKKDKEKKEKEKKDKEKKDKQEGGKEKKEEEGKKKKKGKDKGKKEKEEDEDKGERQYKQASKIPSYDHIVADSDLFDPETGEYAYRQTAALSAVPEADIDEFLQKEMVSISDPVETDTTSRLRPLLHFSQLPASPLVRKKPFATFSCPTPIQSASWPFALSGRDLVGIAETGSGKTLAFSLPCVEMVASRARPKVLRGDRTVRARAVVVSPTRELAMQTHAAMASLASLSGLSAVCLYGGASKDEQRAQLRKDGGADIVVATPGRLKDFLAEGCLTLAEARFVVLDEADRMLDKGFEEDIRSILSACARREERQTLMFTATWPVLVRGLADGFMVEPVKVTVGGRSRTSTDGGSISHELQANSRIQQTVQVVEPREKEYRLLRLLREAQQGGKRHERILVFCLYKKEAVRVEQKLRSEGIRVASIHGDLRQEQRTRSLEAFKSGETTVLVATDVAARGLDIPEVKLVINVTVRVSRLEPWWGGGGAC